MVLIMTSFTENGTPKTGLSATIDVWEDDGTQVVTAQSMTEIGGGFYKYEFAGYDETENYAIRSDGGASLPDHERYTFGINDVRSVKDSCEELLKVEKNKWEIVNNQMLIYEDNGVDVLYTFNLTDESGQPTMERVYKRDPV